MKPRYSHAPILISLLVMTLVLTSVQPAQTAHAVGCKNSGGVSRSLNYSSQVQGTVFTLCGKILIKKVSNTLSMAKEKSKAVAKVKTKSVSKIKAKPKKVLKIKIKRSTKKSNNRSNGYASFRPLRPVASVNANSELKVNQPVRFLVDSKVHFRPSRLLGFRASVRFTPTAFSWMFSDGFESTSRSPSHGFGTPGDFQARALVTFAVAYRFEQGGTWVKDPGTIRLLSNPVQVLVGKKPTAMSQVRLVNQDCAAPSKRGITAIGCKP